LGIFGQYFYITNLRGEKNGSTPLGPLKCQYILLLLLLLLLKKRNKEPFFWSENEEKWFFLFFPVYFAKSTRYYLLENIKEVAFIWVLSIGELFSNLFLSSFFWWNIIQNILQPKIKIIAHFIIR
jgi:hypothetical protein